METFDIILLSIAGGFALIGFWLGFVHALGSLLGTVFGLYIAFRYSSVFADWIIGWTNWEGNMVRVVIFVISFLLIARLVGLLFWLARKFLSVITSLPIIHMFDRLLGGLFGFFEGLIAVGVFVFVAKQFPLSARLSEQIASSVVAPYALGLVLFLLPMLPGVLELIKKSVDYVEKKV